MATDLSWRDAAAQVLDVASQPLHYTEIARRILDRGLKSTVGATPANSLNAALGMSINQDGPTSPFVRHEAGVYGLRDTPPPTNGNGVGGPVAAFGIHWRRDLVQWATRPRLFGRQHAKADRVDLADQHGVYLLHCVRGETVYVGQAMMIGKRLAQHTWDRHAGRWSFFSWFGTRAVDAHGRLSKPGSVSDPAGILNMLEFVLIEAIEPRQNRQRGVGAGSEFIQAIDPRL